MLEVRHLSKSFGKVAAVKDVSFRVKRGSTFAFLGTNGAGKTTVIQMIIGLLSPDQGDIIFVDGSLQEVTGVVFQTHRLDEELTIEENLLIRARLYGLNKETARRRVEELLAETKLTTKRRRLYGTCSGGEKRKVDIIRALLHRPALLILDEPTTGLDAESRADIWKMLRKRQEEEELTIFLTTHYIEEAEAVDQVLIMHEGEVQVAGTPEELRKKYALSILRIIPTDIKKVRDSLKNMPYPYEEEQGNLSITLKTSKEAIPLLHHLEKYISSFTVEEANLENVFLQITEQIKGETKE